MTGASGADAARGPRLFLLSPAFIGGVRAQQLLNPRAPFPRAQAFHRTGLSIAEVFSFASGLYFRGKIAYARRFARAAQGDLIRVITSNGGLVDPERIIGPSDLTAFGLAEIDVANPAYHRPLRRDAEQLAGAAGLNGRAVLLGSIATPKYREVLLAAFGPRLLFPPDFVGRGDMSRGALLLRAAASGEELRYAAVEGAVLTGRRAPGVSRKPVRRRRAAADA